MPSPRLLQHTPVIGEEVLPTATRPMIHATEPGNTTHPLPNGFLPPRVNSAILLWVGFPPIPAKLVYRKEVVSSSKWQRYYQIDSTPQGPYSQMNLNLKDIQISQACHQYPRVDPPFILQYFARNAQRNYQICSAI